MTPRSAGFARARLYPDRARALAVLLAFGWVMLAACVAALLASM